MSVDRRVLSVALALVCLSCVTPMRVSESCRRQIDECLRRCEPNQGVPPAEVDGEGAWGATDNRTTCVQLCHDLCT